MPTYQSIDEVIASYPGRFLPDQAEGVDGVVQLHLTGDGGGDYQLVIQNSQLDVVQGIHEAPTLAVTTSAADWLRVNNGETNSMGLMMQGKLKLKGSLPLAARFQSMFQRAGS